MKVLIHKAEIIDDPDTDEDDYHILLCLVEIAGQLYENFIVPVADFDVAYAVQTHCNTTVDPYVIEFGDD